MLRLMTLAVAAVVILSHVPRTEAADAPGAEPPNLQVELRLLDAVFRGETADDAPSPLLILLRRIDEGWPRCWGTAREVSHNVHPVVPRNVELDDDRLRLEIDVTVRGDARGARDEYALYAVDLKREGDGPYRGTYKGTWRGVPVEGEAEATILPEIEPIAGGFLPPAPGERPRILFRRSDLPRLRQKAETPLGKAALSKMAGPVGLAMKYQLTGDKRYAEEVIPGIRKMMDRGLLSDQYGNNVGDRLEKTALAYDMCYDAWPEEFRREVEFYMLWAGNGVLRARRDTHQGVNWHVASNWSAPLYTGAAFAGLALWGKKGPRPEPPLESFTGAEIPPPADYRPGRGVPVSDFDDGEMPPLWIFLGGLKTDRHEGDPLAALGGAAEARPQVGDEIRFGGKTYRFTPLSEEKDKGYWRHENYDGGKRLIDITNAVGREYFSTNYFFTVLRNDSFRWVQYEAGPDNARAYLNGVRLEPSEVARIKPGLYPLLIEVYIDQINPWGRQLMRPRLVEISANEAAQLVAQQQAKHEQAIKRWRRRVDWWEKRGGLDMAAADLFGRSRHMMYVFCREAVGTGGMQAELAHYSTIAERGPARYESAHLQMFGYHTSPQDDIEALLLRKMFVHLYPEKQEPWALEINGAPKLDGELAAALLPVVPDALKPVALWGWQRHTGFAGENFDALVEQNPVLAFLNYPLDMEPRPPQDRMPLVWRADDFGFYGFRNSFSGGDDFILQTFAKAHTIGGWNAPNAGTFRLVGLGHVWAAGSTDRNRHRWEESVVQLPDDTEVSERGLGRVTYVATQPDGSGVVSIDLSDVYAGIKIDPERNKPVRAYSRYGNIRHDGAFVDLGIRGMRSIGIDYSRRSGTPALIAVVDRIEGGGRKVWTWQLPADEKGDQSDVALTTTDGTSFTVRKPDGATLCGILASGQRPVAEIRMTTMTGRAGSSAGKTLERPIHGVFAETDQKQAGFFFVGTIQNGPAPEIKVRGRGLAAVVTVGGRQVRFDGEKIVFGERPGVP